MFNKQKRNKRIKLSQNYLYNKKLILKLISFANIKKNSKILEIGPGEGAITRELEKTEAKLFLVEKDEDNFKKLKNKFLENKNIEIILGDILKEKISYKDYIVFSNPPFNISSQLIKKLSFSKNSPKEMYLVLQKEAIDRLMGKSKENQMSILLKSIYDISILHTFNKNDFTPSPNVQIVFVKFQKNIDELIEKNLNEYIQFIQYGFQQQKENLRKNFKKVFTNDEWLKLSKNAKFKVNAKVKDIDFKQWKILFNYFLNKKDRKNITESFKIKDPIYYIN